MSMHTNVQFGITSASFLPSEKILIVVYDLHSYWFCVVQESIQSVILKVETKLVRIADLYHLSNPFCNCHVAEFYCNSCWPKAVAAVKICASLYRVIKMVQIGHGKCAKLIGVAFLFASFWNLQTGNKVL